MRKVGSYIYLPIAFALVLILGIYLGSHMSVSNKEGHSLFKTQSGSFERLVDVLNLIQQDYVDTLNREKLVSTAVESILEELDPHSAYISADRFNAVNDPLEGKFEGIGIQFRMVMDTVVVIKPIPDGPSEKAGLMAGDRIVKAEGKTIAGVNMPTDSIVSMLKGKKGTKVNVKVYRRGHNELLNFTITRDEIPTYSLDIAYMPDDVIGYIKLSKFSSTTGKELRNAVKDLKTQGMEKLILDLRGNGGGYMSQAIRVSDEFLEKGKMIVCTKGKNQSKDKKYSTKKGNFKEGELVVLIDEMSASASEIVAGAIQDNDRGTIIGRRSFGKGLVQKQFELEDGAAIRLTVARYYTPAGRCIQKPYKKGNKKEYYSEILKRYQEGKRNNPDSVRTDTSKAFFTAQGDTVYGGGGIFPDIYVSFNESYPNEYAKSLIRTGMIFRYAFKYADENRQYFDKYKNAKSFINNFNVSSSLMKRFRKYAVNKGVKASSEDFERARDFIKNRLKAFIGRNLYNDKAFYHVLNKNDVVFQRAVEYLGKKEV